LIVCGVGVVEVREFTANLHSLSALWSLVHRNDFEVRYIKAIDLIDSVAVLAPCRWSEAHWCVVDTLH
jgi:hypothetical protein